MRIFKKTFIGIVVFLAILYLLPAMLLKVPYFQEKISHQVASYLSKKIQTEVQINKIELDLFNKLVLKDVYLEDLSGEVLFKAKRIAAGFEFIPLINKKLRFNSIQFFTFHFNLSKEKDDSPLNINYILEAFAKDDTIKNIPEIDLSIKNLSLHSGNFSFRVKDKANTPGIFNSKQLFLSDISSKIQIHDLRNNEMSLNIKKMSFKEQSGLHIKNLTFDFNANETEAVITRLLIELSESSLVFTDIIANYELPLNFKNRTDSFTFSMKLNNSTIYPKELSVIFPAFSNFNEQISLEGDFKGVKNNLEIKNFYFRYYNQMMINANAELKNIFHPNRNLFYIKGNISNSFFSPEGIENIINNFSEQRIELPKQIKQLQNIRFEGNINGSFDDLTAHGVWNTNVGVIKANIMLGSNETRFIKGNITSESLDLQRFFNSPDYGEMAFDINLDAKQDSEQKLLGSIDAKIAKFIYKGYTYQNFNLNGDFTPTSFDGRMNMNSSEGKISGEGLWVLEGKDSKFDFNATISDLQLDKLNLTKKYEQPLLSFEVAANLTGNNPDNLIGSISLKNLKFETIKGSYSLDNFNVTSSHSELEKRITIDSDIINGKIWGNYSFKTIVPALKQTFARYLPSFVKPDLKYTNKDDTDFTIQLAINDLTEVSNIFELPFSLRGQTDITGKYNGNEMKMAFAAPHFITGGMKTDSLHIDFANSEVNAQIEISGTSIQRKNSRVKFDVNMNAADDKLNTTLHWGNGSSKYRGDLKLTSSFTKDNHHSPTLIETHIQQTEMIFNDSIWTFYPAKVLIDSSNISIDQIHAAHKDQYLKINGIISKNPDEKLNIELNKINLEYVFQSLSIASLEFGGMATGFVNAQDLYTTRRLETDLDVRDFSFNSVNFGHLNLNGTWDDDNQGVIMRGLAKKNDSTYVDIDGILSPVKKEISINFDAQNADARFLGKYLDNIITDLTGNLSGHVRLFGNWNTPTVEGDVFAKNCRFGVEYLNTYYTFSDSVKCLPDTLKIKNIALYDERGNRATVDGYFKHNLFRDFYFSVSASYTNFMIFNANKYTNPLFYGTAFGTGTLSLYGTQGVVNIDVTAQNTANTKMTLNFMGEEDIEEYNFIRFVSVKNPTTNTSKKQEVAVNPTKFRKNSNGTDIRFNLILNATPQATIEMIMDPSSGDKISGYGNGNIQIKYGTKTPLNVHGNYVIERGKYNFSLQQFFYRDFDIREGSTVAFSGNPFNAELDIKATCTVNANLEDLDRQLIEKRSSARNNVQVSCILMLSGPLERPKISFDLDLPGATEELVRQVKSYIRTDDMMNLQMAYLLVLSRFYTPPENMRGSNTTNNSNWSYLTSTLSSQLSNVLGLLSDNFQVGTVFHQSTIGAQTSTEFELLLSSQLLNNRLIVNGNFGYVNNPIISGNQNNIPLIGDFDLEYKLTKSGDIRLKGYNHYNFRNYYSITPEMTQGLGILFRKDFNHWLDLVRRRNPRPKNTDPVY